MEEITIYDFAQQIKKYKTVSVMCVSVLDHLYFNSVQHNVYVMMGDNPMIIFKDLYTEIHIHNIKKIEKCVGNPTYKLYCEDNTGLNEAFMHEINIICKN